MTVVAADMATIFMAVAATTRCMAVRFPNSMATTACSVGPGRPHRWRPGVTITSRAGACQDTLIGNDGDDSLWGGAGVICSRCITGRTLTRSWIFRDGTDKLLLQGEEGP